MSVAERVLQQIVVVARANGGIDAARVAAGDVDCAVLMSARRFSVDAPADVRARVQSLLDELVCSSIGIR
jgi:hypothetical protein